jgi:hypothetical protein
MAKPKTTNESDVPSIETTDRQPSLEQRIEQQAADIASLTARVDTLTRVVEALERDNPKGITASAPVPLNATEAIRAIKANSAVRFTALSDYAALGLRSGETFEPRHRLAGEHLLASHIASGLRIVEAA